MKHTILAAVIILSTISIHAHALSVGTTQVDSHLGEPLDFSVSLDALNADQFSTLHVSLATPETFSELGLAYPEKLNGLHIELGGYGNGQASLRVKTSDAITDPFINLLLEISWSGGKIIREFTLLIDPADYRVEQAVPAGVPAVVAKDSKQAPAQNTVSPADSIHLVKEGETISSIAAQYRPQDTTPQQAWIAFYKLNESVFPDGNINRTKKGMRLHIPSDDQMRETGHGEAVLELKRLSS